MALLMTLIVWALSAQGVVVGDDMGYCFADTTPVSYTHLTLPTT